MFPESRLDIPSGLLQFILKLFPESGAASQNVVSMIGLKG